LAAPSLLQPTHTHTISAHRTSSSSNQLGLPYPFFAVVDVGVIDFLPLGSGSLVYFTVGVGVADGDRDTGIGRWDFIV
jgi:opacity protein-like surface antigen